MAELQSKKKSFNQAFAEARKRGESKFQWNGAWYSTQTKEEKNTPTKGGINRANYKQKIANSNGTINNRFIIKYKNDVGYYIWDNNLQRQIGNAFKNKQDAVKYLTSADVKNKYDEGFMLDAGETTITAARAKLNRNIAGFQSVDSNKNFVDKDGNTRLYQERSTGRYLVTDNNGNIVGYSFDPAAATADSKWGGWIAYTGSKDDIKAAAAGQLRDEANRNEVNQKARQAKERITDDRERQMNGIRGLQGGFNTIQSMINLPNHAIIGGLKMVGQNIWDGKWATEDVRNARLQEYLKGFTIDGMWRGEQQVGLGDLIEAENPYVRTGLNFINPMTVMSVYNGYKNFTPTQRGALGRYQTKPKVGKVQQVVEYDLTEQPARVVNGKAPNGEVIVTKAKFVPNNNLQTRYYTTKPEIAPLSSKTKQVGARYRNTGSNNAENIKRLDQAGRFMSHQNWVVEGTPFQMIPFNAAFRYDPKTTYIYSEETPTANFWYSGEGNPNTYAQGRIVTGEVVPGTSGENWNGGVSGGTVIVDNRNGQVAPAFGGVTIGVGRDNQSGWYLPLAYKKGGKAKLVSKKSCRK